MIRYAVDIVMQAFAEQMVLDVVNRHPRGPISMSTHKIPWTDKDSQLKEALEKKTVIQVAIMGFDINDFYLLECRNASSSIFAHSGTGLIIPTIL